MPWRKKISSPTTGWFPLAKLSNSPKQKLNTPMDDETTFKQILNQPWSQYAFDGDMFSYIFFRTWKSSPLYGGLFSDTLQPLSFNVNRSVRFESPIVPSCCCRPSRQLLETCLLNAVSRPIYPSPWAQRKK